MIRTCYYDPCEQLHKGLLVNNTLDSKEERIMRELIRMCHDVSAVSKARLAAAVTVRGEVLAWGTNEGFEHE